MLSSILLYTHSLCDCSTRHFAHISCTCLCSKPNYPNGNKKPSSLVPNCESSSLPSYPMIILTPYTPSTSHISTYTYLPHRPPL